MSGNFKREDLRVIKTQKALHNAMSVLLERRRFKQITVNDLCGEALTSRAAFYTHYKDKYDLLEGWFSSLLTELKTNGVADVIGSLVYNNSRIMQNILFDADTEVISIVVNQLVSSLLSVCDDLPSALRTSPEYIVLSNFCSGGFYEMVKWQGEQKYSKAFQETQEYFFHLIKAILEFHVNYKK